MAREVQTDYWVSEMLKSLGVSLEGQGSSNFEIENALKTASKQGTGRPGRPEFVGLVNDNFVVIEDKASILKHVKMTEAGHDELSFETADVVSYAVNGACFYARHILGSTPYTDAFAIGVSGDRENHAITPVYVNDRGEYKILPTEKSLAFLSDDRIDDYFSQNVLGNMPNEEMTTERILSNARVLHRYFRDYGSLKETDKPLVVSGILLALNDRAFSIDSLHGDSVNTDGKLIYDAIERYLRSYGITSESKRERLMSEFSVILNSERLNAYNDKLGGTPIKFYAQFLNRNIRQAVVGNVSSEDFIGRFYGEFMRYSGGDGQTLGIVLTPRHICDLFCELLDLGPDDVVLDPCCGTGGFLVAAMHYMLAKAGRDDVRRENIKKKQLHGFEIQNNMFAIAASNMILRGDGNSNIVCTDFFSQKAAVVQQKCATVGMMNPPYSQGTKDNSAHYELSFVSHLLDSLVAGGRAAVIIPQSAMTGKTNIEKEYKMRILENHTLEGVITCNTDTFYHVGVNPVIAVFTAHRKHPENKVCKFIDFRDDGYVVHAHVGLVEGDSAKEKRKYLLDVWNDRVEAPTSFCVKSSVRPDDEWLHSFYYFNDEIPTDADFEKTIGDYLTFEFSMIMQNRGYLFEKKGTGEDDED